MRSWSPIEANLKTYRDLWRAARAAPDWRAGLSVWFAAPSAPLRAPGHPAFEPHAFTPFDPPESAAQRRQYLFHYGVLFLVSLGFLALPPGRGAVAAWALGALLIAKAALLGRAMMARPVLGADLIWWLGAGLTALGPLAAPPDLVIAAALSGAIASLGFGLAARRAPITP